MEGYGSKRKALKVLNYLVSSERKKKHCNLVLRCSHLPFLKFSASYRYIPIQNPQRQLYKHLILEFE